MHLFFKKNSWNNNLSQQVFCYPSKIKKKKNGSEINKPHKYEIEQLFFTMRRVRQKPIEELDKEEDKQKDGGSLGSNQSNEKTDTTNTEKNNVNSNGNVDPSKPRQKVIIEK